MSRSGEPGRPSSHSDSNSAISTPMTLRLASCDGAGAQILERQAARHLVFDRHNARFEHVAVEMHIDVACTDRGAQPLGKARARRPRLSAARRRSIAFSCGSRSRAPTSTTFDKIQAGAKPAVPMARRAGEDHAAEVRHRVGARQIRIAMRVEPDDAGIRVAFRHHGDGGEPRRATSHGEDERSPALSAARSASAKACRSPRAAASCSSQAVLGSGACGLLTNVVVRLNGAPAVAPSIWAPAVPRVLRSPARPR